MKEFLLQEPEPEPEPEPRARIWFRFFLGQNDTVPAVPVPQHWSQVISNSFCSFSRYYFRGGGGSILGEKDLPI